MKKENHMRDGITKQKHKEQGIGIQSRKVFYELQNKDNRTRKTKNVLLVWCLTINIERSTSIKIM